MILGVLRRLDDADIRADDPHADGAGDGTNQQKLASSKLIDQEQQPDEGHDSLDDTENAGHQVHGIRINANTLENDNGQQQCNLQEIAKRPALPKRWWENSS